MNTPTMPVPRALRQVDVFTALPDLDIPLAVVLDGTGLDDAAMQRFARRTNLWVGSDSIACIDGSVMLGACKAKPQC